jgi:hypothetical protein
VSPPGRLECRFPGYGLSGNSDNDFSLLGVQFSAPVERAPEASQESVFPGSRGRLPAQRLVSEVMDTLDLGAVHSNLEKGNEWWCFGGRYKSSFYGLKCGFRNGLAATKVN